MADFKSALKVFFGNKPLKALTLGWVVLIILLFILWRYLIQKNQFPIYSSIKIFPFQYALFVAVINFALAFAVAKKSPIVSQLLIGLAILITALSILMVFYTYRFFTSSV